MLKMYSQLWKHNLLLTAWFPDLTHSRCPLYFISDRLHRGHSLALPLDICHRRSRHRRHLVALSVCPRPGELVVASENYFIAVGWLYVFSSVSICSRIYRHPYVCVWGQTELHQARQRSKSRQGQTVPRPSPRITRVVVNEPSGQPAIGLYML